MNRDVLKIILLHRITIRSVVNIGCSYVIVSSCGVHEFCREKFKLVQSFSCPSLVLVNMIYCSVNYCCSNSSIPGVFLHSIMKPLKDQTTPLIIDVHFDPQKYGFADCTILGDFVYISYLCLFIYLWIQLGLYNYSISIKPDKTLLYFLECISQIQLALYNTQSLSLQIIRCCILQYVSLRYYQFSVFFHICLTMRECQQQRRRWSYCNVSGIRSMSILYQVLLQNLTVR